MNHTQSHRMMLFFLQTQAMEIQHLRRLVQTLLRTPQEPEHADLDVSQNPPGNGSSIDGNI